MDLFRLHLLQKHMYIFSTFMPIYQRKKCRHFNIFHRDVCLKLLVTLCIISIMWTTTQKIFLQVRFFQLFCQYILTNLNNWRKFCKDCGKHWQWNILSSNHRWCLAMENALTRLIMTQHVDVWSSQVAQLPVHQGTHYNCSEFAGAQRGWLKWIREINCSVPTEVASNYKALSMKWLHPLSDLTEQQRSDGILRLPCAQWFTGWMWIISFCCHLANTWFLVWPR